MAFLPEGEVPRKGGGVVQAGESGSTLCHQTLIR